MHFWEVLLFRFVRSHESRLLGLSVYDQWPSKRQFKRLLANESRYRVVNAGSISEQFLCEQVAAELHACQSTKDLNVLYCVLAYQALLSCSEPSVCMCIYIYFYVYTKYIFI